MTLSSRLAACYLIFVVGVAVGQSIGQTPAATAKPLSLAQVWKLDARYTDAAHGVSFRYPSIWHAGTQFGYAPPALTSAQVKPIAGFIYEEGGFPRDRIVGPYSTTNLEGFGIVVSADSAGNAAACEAKASAVAAAMTDAVGKPRPIVLGGQTFSVRELGARGMNQWSDDKLYATFTHSTCYLFETGEAEVDPEVAVGVTALTDVQRRSIDDHLLSIMESVRIRRR